MTAAGLLAYAVFKLCSCLFDVEHHGGAPTGLAVRLAKGCGAIVYAAFAWSAFELANGNQYAAASGTGVQHASHTLLSNSFGALVLGPIGAGFCGAAVGQIVQAITAHFMKRVFSRAPNGVEWVGRAGHVARAAVFGIVGWSLMHSAWWYQRVHVTSPGDGVDAMGGNTPLYTAVAVALLLFGLFSLLLASYRVIPDIDCSDLKPRLS